MLCSQLPPHSPVYGRYIFIILKFTPPARPFYEFQTLGPSLLDLSTLISLSFFTFSISKMKFSSLPQTGSIFSSVKGNKIQPNIKIRNNSHALLHPLTLTFSSMANLSLPDSLIHSSLFSFSYLCWYYPCPRHNQFLDFCHSLLTTFSSDFLLHSLPESDFQKM